MIDTQTANQKKQPIILISGFIVNLEFDKTIVEDGHELDCIVNALRQIKGVKGVQAIARPVSYNWEIKT